MQEPVFAKPREVNSPELSNKGYNLPPVLQQKWVRDKDSGSLTKVKDITMDLKKVPADLNGHKEQDKEKPKDDSSPQSNGVSSSKLKIVKNKNKNGRIVIVMSKYMDKGMQAAKVKNGDCETADKAQQGADNSTERHLEKMKLVKKLGLMNGFAKNYPKDKATVFSSGINGDGPKEKQQSPKIEPATMEQDKHVEVRGQGQLAADQPLQLTTKPNLLSLPAERGVSFAVDKKATQGGLQGLKRHHTHSEEHGSSKRFLNCTGVNSASSSSLSTEQHGPQDCGYADQEEPMDLSMIKSRPNAGDGAKTRTQAEAQTQSPACNDAHSDKQMDAESDTKPPTDTQSVEEDRADAAVCVPSSAGKKEEAFPSFQPFLGNIIITDITTNCLTVTFKEYVTV